MCSASTIPAILPASSPASPVMRQASIAAARRAAALGSRASNDEDTDIHAIPRGGCTAYEASRTHRSHYNDLIISRKRFGRVLRGQGRFRSGGGGALWWAGSQ